MISQRDTPEPAGGFVAEDGGERWGYKGALTFANASRVFAEAVAMPLPSTGEIDLAGTAAVDSSAVAVLLALRRRAAEEGRLLVFIDVPPALTALADLYSVEDLLAA